MVQHPQAACAQQGGMKLGVSNKHHWSTSLCNRNIGVGRQASRQGGRRDRGDVDVAGSIWGWVKTFDKPTMSGDSWNFTQENGDGLGIVYGIGEDEHP